MREINRQCDSTETTYGSNQFMKSYTPLLTKYLVDRKLKYLRAEMSEANRGDEAR